MRFLEHSVTLFFVRFASIIAMSLWLGGFMFYGGIVVPILEDAFGKLDAGMLVTRHATSKLNLVGFGTLAAWWVLIIFEGRIQPSWARRGRIFFLALSSVTLAILFILHTHMDRHLDTRGVRDFKPFHRLYLLISSGQWVANLAILALTIRLWAGWKRSEVSVNFVPSV